MTGFSKMLSPGQKPRPDYQGKAFTCTSHGVGKALTGGLYYGRFGTVLDVSQNEVVNALIQLLNNVGACWPDEFDQKSILAYDRTSSMYYTISIKVDEIDFPKLHNNWNQASFVVVYKSSQGPHCVYVNNVKNGKLCCLNSHGKTDGFPQLKPEDVTAIYQVSASVKKAPEKSQPKPTTPRLRRSSQSSIQNSLTSLTRQTSLPSQTSLASLTSHTSQTSLASMTCLTSQISLTKQTEVESENARLRQEVMNQKKKIEELEMLVKMDNENEKLEKTKNFWRNPKSLFKVLKEKATKKFCS